jgi:indole-3-glycerol phosphate synthase/phosphoribosylanthranilate isomerase
MTKVCGITRTEDALGAWSAGATHGGLIFASESPRTVDVERARRLRDTAPPSLQWVGVFVSEAPERIGELATRLRLAAVQLHGEETPETVQSVKALVPEKCEVWKAVRVRDSIPAVGGFNEDRLLLDTWSADTRGGTGETFDWSLLDGRPDLDRIILSGGLTPSNAAAAEATGVGGLDVNSGVETKPGIKDAKLVAAFLAARRGVGRRRENP